jgi:hypothetical protein
LIARRKPKAGQMLDTVVAHRVGIGQALGVIGATATVVIFEQVFGFGWYISIPVAVLAYVSMPMLWTRFLDALMLQSGR